MKEISIQILHFHCDLKRVHYFASKFFSFFRGDLDLYINPSVPIPDKEKINLNFCFHTSFWCLKSFVKGFKAFTKPFEAPQQSV